MTISAGSTLPEASFWFSVPMAPKSSIWPTRLKGRKVVIFGLPGAYTGTCTTAHVPSFMRTKDAFAAKGVDEIICVSVNDPFVMKAWGDSTGATEAGITFAGDADGSFTAALGLEFSAPAVGLIGRSKRYALYAEDGLVKVLHVEESPGICEASGGESLLAAI
ncbi:MAG: peroxiredoxin [Gemmobacter sp.]|nr:peroxiredoxin [Gemmobacter sp.]